MHILLTNDDGIHAPGIMAMYEALVHGTSAHAGPLGGQSTKVEVVAPLTVQSATSHGITFHEPLMVREERLHLPGTPGGTKPTGIAVDGRPADCVKLAVSSLLPERWGSNVKPDLIISGINAGANCGINVIYSGTVAAAIEGAFLGVPSIAISLRMARSVPRFDIAAARARHVLERILQRGVPHAHEVLNINLPATRDESTSSGSTRAHRHENNPRAEAIDTMGRTDPGSMPALRVCPMNTHGLIDRYDRRTSPTGEVYYWAAGHGLDFHATEPGTDVDLLMQGHITLTPLHFDLTNRGRFAAWEGA
jgi:5'-nucleotidase